MEDEKIVIGRNPVLEYLRSGAAGEGDELYVSASAHGKILDVIRDEAARRRVRVIACGKSELGRFEATSAHQGVALRLARRLRDGAPEDLLVRVASKKGVIVALDQLTDPHNIGSIIRTVEVLGGDAVVMAKAHSPGVTPTVVKSSAGATAHLDVRTVPNLARFLDEAKRAGFTIIGTSGEGSSEMSMLAESLPAVVIIGNEGEGMRSLTAKMCDFSVRIPVRGRVSSLNASVAAGIILYELLRYDGGGRRK